MDDLLKVGIITNTHGLRGEVKVFPTTDDPKRFLDLEEVILSVGRKQQAFGIENVRFFKNMVIVKFKGIDTIYDSAGYRRGELLVTSEQAVPLGESGSGRFDRASSARFTGSESKVSVWAWRWKTYG